MVMRLNLEIELSQFIRILNYCLDSQIERMFITKQLQNKKERKMMQPHKRQILNQIRASIDDEDWRISRQVEFMSTDLFTLKKQKKRPHTAKPTSTSLQRPHTSSTLNRQRPQSSSHARLATTPEVDERSNSFIKKVNYQFKELTQIGSLFERFFNLKKKKVQSDKFKYPKRTQEMKQDLIKKEKEQIQCFEKMKRSRIRNANQHENQYMGYPKEKAKKIISVAKAKNQDVKMITSCIKGGYFSQADEFSDKINKSEILQLKKNFITMSNLYNDVKGSKNKGISEISPQTIDKSSFKNLVYFLQNEKNLKYSDKLAISQKIRLIS